MANKSTAAAKPFDQADFRKELLKVMPGYSWTVHKSHFPDIYLSATGTQSSGFNRLSTLSVERRDRDGIVTYEVKSAGFGKKAPWVFVNTGSTLAKALRALQDHYRALAHKYRILEADMQNGRVNIVSETVSTVTES